MALSFALNKATESLKLELQKRSIQTIVPCQVKLAMDVSGSFDDEHRQGYTQDLLNRFMPFALIFDKDGVIDSYTFATKSGRLPKIDKDNFDSYIQSKVINCYGYNGCTYYKPVLELIAEDASPHDVVVSGGQEAIAAKPAGFFGKMFGKKDVQEQVAVAPVITKGETEKELIFFVTDGAADDTDKAKEFIQKMGKENVFFVFISVGDRDIQLFKESFESTPFSIYLKLTKSEIRNLHSWTDEQMYDLLLQPSLIAWMDKQV